MSQNLDDTKWRSIWFEGVDLPQSLMGISIMIVVDDFTERTGDWIWALPHCNGIEKFGCAQWCLESAAEILDYLTGNRVAVLAMIEERLGPHGFDSEATFAEWVSSLTRIQEIAVGMDADCHWFADVPGLNPKPGLEQAMRFFDSLDPEEP
jgi:hypothetical protein